MMKSIQYVFFDVESQRSVEKIQTYDVFPAAEWILSEDEIDAGFEKVKDEVEKQLVTLGMIRRKRHSRRWMHVTD